MTVNNFLVPIISPTIATSKDGRSQFKPKFAKGSSFINETLAADRALISNVVYPAKMKDKLLLKNFFKTLKITRIMDTG